MTPKKVEAKYIFWSGDRKQILDKNKFLLMELERNKVCSLNFFSGPPGFEIAEVSGLFHHTTIALGTK